MHKDRAYVASKRIKAYHRMNNSVADPFRENPLSLKRYANLLILHEAQVSEETPQSIAAYRWLKNKKWA